MALGKSCLFKSGKGRNIAFAVGVLMVSILVLAPQGFAFGGWGQGGTPVAALDGCQRYPCVAPDGKGGAIIAWSDSREGANGADIYAQRINRDGRDMWTHNGVAVCQEDNAQMFPRIAADGAGGAFIAWTSLTTQGRDIYAQRVSADGELMWAGGGVRVCTSPLDQFLSTITQETSGGVVLAWTDYRDQSTRGSAVYAQMLSPDGTIRWREDGVLLSKDISDQLYPVAVRSEYGGAIIAWINQKNPIDMDIYAQWVDSLGQMRWGSTGEVICDANDYQSSHVMVADGRGGAVIAWQDLRNSTVTGMDIYAQRVDCRGDDMWSQNGVPVCEIRGYQLYPNIVSCDDNGVIIGWHDNHYSSVRAMKLKEDGQCAWPHSQGTVISPAVPQPQWVSMATDDAGGAYFAWNADSRYWIQRVSGEGSMVYPAGGLALSPDQGHSSHLRQTISADGHGGALIAWQDGRKYSDYEEDIFAQRIPGSNSLPAITPSKNAKAANQEETLKE